MGLTFRLGQIPLAIQTDTSNNVGIGGAANASFKLQVTGTTNLTAALSGTTANFTSNDNNFAFNVELRNTNTGTQALTGFGLSDSSGTRKGQLLWIPSNYVTTSLQNSFLVSSVTNIPLVLCADATGAATPNIKFQSGATDKMTLFGTSGNLVIGSSTDNGSKLQVAGAATFSSSVTAGGLFTAQGGVSAAPATSGTTINGSAVIKPSDGSNAIIMGAYGTAPYGNWIQSQSTSALGTTFPLVLQPNGGNAGIGTSSPVRKLDIVATGEQLRLAYDTGGTTYTDFRNDSAGGLLINTSGGYIINYIGGSEKMRTLSNGNVLIGTTSDNGFKLQVNGSISTTSLFAYGGNVTCIGTASSTIGAGPYTSVVNSGNSYQILQQLNASYNLDFWSFRGSWTNVSRIDGSSGAYTALSDSTKKKDFEESTIGLNEVLQLKPTLFRMKTDDENAPKQLGFLAQDVKDIIPQAYVEQDNFIGLQDRPIIAALVKAIQEQQAQIEELKQLINK